MGRHLFLIFFSYVTDNFHSFVIFSLRYQPPGRLWEAPTMQVDAIIQQNIKPTYSPVTGDFGWIK